MTTDPRSRQKPPEHRSPGGAGRGAGADATPGDGETLVLTQAFDVGSLYGLRAAVAAHADAAGLPQHRADDLVVAVHELAANAVLHGAGHGQLRLWHDEHVLQCQVSDDGPPTAGAGADASPELRDASRWHSERGHGLWLIRQVADQVSVHSGPDGTIATISFTLPPPG
jgi:anti-sigma regulatory factor (Ser/Thr protein kinase)